ncbi:HAMP domain-containing sensor histidine kinase [Cognatishimia sp. SS12]|uniref:sensor histidine kinase n=1 Tax=Cognatishimia sp. SS12 TaxID=2979465 RepID=UPI00232DBF87|nr:HAMP domain-containing sensor histidine kinase [Cognatishimia sp. SS12]MDC0737220.1 HAMP domain-containing sensor histidine kinase [Cognatishimia sp. SS12]
MIDWRLAKRAAIITVLIGLVAGLFTFNSAQESLLHAKSNHRGGPLWMATQIEVELLKFNKALALYVAEAPGYEHTTVNHRFDLLWSRWNIASQGDAGAWLRDMDAELNVINDLGATLRAQDTNVTGLGDTDRGKALRILGAFYPFESRMHDLSLVALDVAGDAEKAVRDDLRRISTRLRLMSYATVLVAILMISIFWLDARNQARIADEKSRLLELAEAGFRAKADFISTISHELRTPMTAIIGAIGLLKSGSTGALSEAGARVVDMADRSGQRLNALIESLLAFEKFQSENLDLECREFCLCNFLDEVIEACSMAAAQKQIEIKKICASDTIKMYADPEKLSQVFQELLGNAIKFSGQGGAVTVRVLTDERSVTVAVKDNGCGMSEEFVPRAFDKFTQEDSSDKRAFSGVGNGLFFTKSFVHAHNGTITLDSEKDVGTTVTVSLPLTQS